MHPHIYQKQPRHHHNNISAIEFASSRAEIASYLSPRRVKHPSELCSLGWSMKYDTRMHLSFIRKRPFHTNKTTPCHWVFPSLKTKCERNLMQSANIVSWPLGDWEWSRIEHGGCWVGLFLYAFKFILRTISNVRLFWILSRPSLFLCPRQDDK